MGKLKIIRIPLRLTFLIMAIAGISATASQRDQNLYARDVSPGTFFQLQSTSTSLTVMGTVRNAQTGGIIEGIKMEVYLNNEEGEKSLAFSGDFNFGRIYVVLSRSYTYQLIVYGIGYEAIDLFLDPQNVPDGETVVRYDFLLKEETTSNSALIPYVPERREAVQPDASSISETTPRQVRSPVDYSQRERPTESEMYRLTGSTSFRKGPSSKTGVILRFRPNNQVKVLEKEDKWWWKVQYQGRTGFVKAQLLVPSK